METGQARWGLRDPEKCGDKRDEARRRALERNGTNRRKGFDSQGGRGAVEEVCNGAFTEEKPSWSLVEKSNLVTERIGSVVVHSTHPSSRGERNATHVRKRNRTTLYRSTIELQRRSHWSESTLKLSVLPAAFTENVLLCTYLANSLELPIHLYLPRNIYNKSFVN